MEADQWGFAYEQSSQDSTTAVATRKSQEFGTSGSSGSRSGTIPPMNSQALMALRIRNPRAVQLAHELSAATGASLTDVVITALEVQLKILKRAGRAQFQSDVAQLQDFLASQPDRETRSPEEILGYDAFGIPT